MSTIEAEEPLEARLPQCVSPEEVNMIASQFVAMRDRKTGLADQLPSVERIRMQSMIRHPDEQTIDEWAWGTAAGVVDVAESSIQQMTGSFEPRQAFILGMIMHCAQGAILDTLKVRLLGAESPSGIVNAPLSRLSEYLTFRLAAEYFSFLKSDEEGGKHLYHIAEHIRVHKKFTVAWYGPKIENFASDLVGAFSLLKHLESLAEEVEPNEEASLREENDQLFEQLKLLQKYGVKDAIAPALHTSESVQEWLFANRSLVMNDQGNITNGGSRYLMGDAAALIIGTPGRMTTSRVELTEMAAKHHTGIRNMGITRASLGIPDSAKGGMTALQLDRDGEVRLFHGGRLKDLCEEMGAGAAYEALRAELLSIHFDMVVPVMVQRLAEDESDRAAPGEPKGEAELQAARLRRLVLARRRVLEVLGDEVGDLIDQEEDEGQQELTRRTLKRHPVIDTIRKLPPNYRASVAARQLCFEETGIVLAEYGETYVRKHDRGGGEYVDLGHRATFQDGAVRRLEEREERKGRKPKPGRYTAPKKRASQ